MASNYLIQFPNTATNPTSKFRVINRTEYSEYLTSAARLFKVYGLYDSLPAAKSRVEELDAANDSEAREPESNG